MVFEGQAISHNLPKLLETTKM